MQLLPQLTSLSLHFKLWWTSSPFFSASLFLFPNLTPPTALALSYDSGQCATASLSCTAVVAAQSAPQTTSTLRSFRLSMAMLVSDSSRVDRLFFCSSFLLLHCAAYTACESTLSCPALIYPLFPLSVLVRPSAASHHVPSFLFFRSHFLECISFQSVNFPTKYIAPIDTEEPGRLGIVDAPAAADASFAVVAGLANASALSFRSQAAGALNGAYLALDGTLRGKCAGFYSPPASDLALVAAPAKGNATWELVQPPPPPPVLVTVNSDNVTHDVNPFFLGCHSDSGFVHQARGFYSQMVFGNSFEASLPEGPAWVTVTPKGGSGTAAIDTSRPFHGNASMRLEYTSPGDGVFGVANRGLGSEGLFIEGTSLSRPAIGQTGVVVQRLLTRSPLCFSSTHTFQAENPTKATCL